MSGKRTDGRRSPGPEKTEVSPAPDLGQGERTQIAPFDASQLGDDTNEELPVFEPEASLEEEPPTDRRPAAPVVPSPAPREARPRSLSLPKPGEARSSNLDEVLAAAAADPPARAEPDAPARPRATSLPGRPRAVVERSTPPRGEVRAPRESSRSRPPAGSSPSSPSPAAAPPRPERSPAREPAPRSRTAVSRYGMFSIIGLVAAIAGVFVYGATRKSAELAPGPGAEPEGVLASLFRATPETATPEVTAAAPSRRGQRTNVVRKDGPSLPVAQEPTVKRKQRQMMMFGFRDPTTHERYGFEVPERPKHREYETDAGPTQTPMLMVFTDPPGVAVDLDGMTVGVTPMLRLLAPNTERVSVRLWGGAYKEHKASLKRDAEGNFRLGVTMELKDPNKPRPKGGPLPERLLSASMPRPPDPDEVQTQKGAK